MFSRISFVVDSAPLRRHAGLLPRDYFHAAACGQPFHGRCHAKTNKQTNKQTNNQTNTQTKKRKLNAFTIGNPIFWRQFYLKLVSWRGIFGASKEVEGRNRIGWGDHSRECARPPEESFYEIAAFENQLPAVSPEIRSPLPPGRHGSIALCRQENA